MRILVTGASGRLGSQLIDVLTPRGHTLIGADVSASSAQPDSIVLDVSDFNATRAAVRAVQPDLVIHSAAWTDVDGCARDPEQAVRVNGFGAQHVALAAAQVGAAVLYVSSNEVFDGRAKQPYREYDPQKPANPYGYSKFVGEQATQAVNPRHYIVRTAWLFAHGGRNFLQAILNAAEQGKPLRVVIDEVANPTYAPDLAQAIAELVETERFGIYHLVNAGFCSRYAFARYVLDRAGLADVPVVPISSREWQRASQPPLYSALSNHAGALANITLRPWQEAVDAFLAREGLLIRANDG
jgi:dTDP-4-dehydrorhamnose reductase